MLAKCSCSPSVLSPVQFSLKILQNCPKQHGGALRLHYSKEGVAAPGAHGLVTRSACG